MRLPRITTRTLMGLVAVSALVMTLAVRVEMDRRRDRFRRLAASHEREWSIINEVMYRHTHHIDTWVRYDRGKRAYFLGSKARKDYEARMKSKYAQAALTPWLPVPADPPPPR